MGMNIDAPHRRWLGVDEYPALLALIGAVLANLGQGMSRSFDSAPAALARGRASRAASTSL
jgi:hypothetical protein